MLSAVYLIILEAAVCGLMINRTLTSKTSVMWHFPIYITIKTVAASVMFFVNGTGFITLLGISLSLLYAVLCFSDKISKKLLVIGVESLCIAASNLFKLSFLTRYGLTQQYYKSEDVLASVICISFSLLLFTVFTVIATNVICKVRLKVVALISGMMLLNLTLCTIVYEYMYSIIIRQLNGIFTVYALIYLLPAIVLLYFCEAVMFSSKDNYFKS